MLWGQHYASGAPKRINYAHSTHPSFVCPQTGFWLSLSTLELALALHLTGVDLQVFFNLKSLFFA
jgi:hypothetical protein